MQIDKAARLVGDTLLRYPTMGNLSSSQVSHHSDSKRRLFWRKRSWRLNRFHLGCTSARNHSTESLDSNQASSKLFNEKALLEDQLDRQPSPISQVDHASSPSLVYSPSLSSMHTETDAEAAYQDFLKQFPGTVIIYPKSLLTNTIAEYRLTWILDSLRRTDFRRLERANETYVDYMGGSIYPESLIRVHTDFLSHHILGNTHSASNTWVYAHFLLRIAWLMTHDDFRSKLSLRCVEGARQAVLSHFKASSDYTVVFTPNASAALKLVGEAYPFTGGGCLVIGADSHNSVSDFSVQPCISMANVLILGTWHPGICGAWRCTDCIHSRHASWRF